MRTIQHWIDGSGTHGSSTRTAPVFDPATGRQQAEVLLADAGDVDAAVAAARKGFEKWRHVSLSRRSRVMFNFRNLVMENVDELARIVADEHGKVFGDAKGEIVRGMEISEYVCGLPQLLKGEYSDQVSTEVDSYSFRQPLGICAGITPFNFPVMVPMWMHPVAIACGNAFILKPSERVPSASYFFAELYQKAGLPDGVFNVVQGDKTAVDAILAHPDISAVSFVGSTPIAQYVYERGTAAGKRVQALGGAKNHCLVMPDANLDFAANHITAAAYGSSGQRCMAISVAVVVGNVGDALVEKLKEKALAVKMGPAADQDSEMGPVITAASRDRIVDYIGRGEAAGATVVVDGRTAGSGQGFFVGPTLFDNVTTDMDVYRDEIFGPVLTVVRVNSAQEGIDLINRNPYGNGTCIFTSSGSAARKFQRDVSAGMVGINVPVPVPMAFYSFGGWKASLFGDKHIHGPEGIKFYTRGKVVTARWPELDMPEEHAGHMHFPVAV
jgi:malonate-semialdehyde dehydrogenase (acetylating)/methylmalonate-semialdehyde dehydrogenase